MRHHDTVFHQLTKQIDWQAFDAAVARHGGDRGARRLRCRDQLGAMIHAQLSGARSLRDIEAGMAGQAGRLYHAGFRPPARSTLADANRLRTADIFAEAFTAMAARAERGLRRTLGRLRILDATRLPLSEACRGWADGPNGAVSAKLHLVYAPEAGVPVGAEITGPRVNDITPARAADIERGATYVFDLGYYSYDYWADLDAHDCRFVTRLKRHTTLVGRRPLSPARGAILSDQAGRVRTRNAARLTCELREIEVEIGSGKVLRLVTNDLVSPAEEIADLYRTRWQIELAFKWIKQNLKIRTFLGTTWNAVRIQIYCALIAYLLVRLAHHAQAAVPAATTFLRLVSQNLMHRRPVQTLGAQNPPNTKDPRQKQMALICT